MAAADDPFDLRRFVDAQHNVYQTALDELRSGRKRSHWIWFIFPQLRGLGRSPTAHHYGIASRDEALAYLRHPVLGPRLRECAKVVAQIEDRSAEEIFGRPDNLKVRSSMTLFAEIASLAGADDSEFVEVLDRLYGGTPDPATLGLLGRI
ncbi:DUF1810 domain-containing protein [Mycolicibacterium goodii]|uniref:Calpastatin n=1 Tax=Mycolicibacterium goodii TaxID=134601 RepID=A0A0K0X9L5_MYCGD|nr:calpastatin [Mycolicibacterium goodii]